MPEPVRVHRLPAIKRVRMLKKDGPPPLTAGEQNVVSEVVILDKIEMTQTSDLQFPVRRVRNHPESQIESLAEALKTFGFLVPVAIDDHNYVWAGEARVKAARRLNLEFIPTVNIAHLPEARKRAFRLYENKIAERARWNRDKIALEFPELEPLLLNEGLDITITGFAPVEIDQVMLDMETNSADPANEFDTTRLSQPPISRAGDVWRLGNHVLACGDALSQELLQSLMDKRKATMAFLDPPYNVQVRNVVGRGKIKHAEFAMASGEQTPEEFTTFLKKAMASAAAVCRDGALNFICMDWRHVEELYRASRKVYSTMINLCVWVKSNGGQGSLYRSQHELIGVFRVGNAKHLNNIELGRHGRSRTNVWQYAGVNSFRAGRMDDLQAHPTVKPIAMVCDAIRDCTRRGDTILDTFAGSGTTLLAAERLARRAVCTEIEPRFVDLTISRWQEFTGKDAIHSQSGRTFNDLSAQLPQGKAA